MDIRYVPGRNAFNLSMISEGACRHCQWSRACLEWSRVKGLVPLSIPAVIILYWFKQKRDQYIHCNLSKWCVGFVSLKQSIVRKQDWTHKFAAGNIGLENHCLYKYAGPRDVVNKVTYNHMPPGEEKVRPHPHKAPKRGLQFWGSGSWGLGSQHAFTACKNITRSL